MDPYNTPAAPQPGSTTDTEPAAWAEPVPTEPTAGPEAEASEEGGRSATAREWMTQLQGMIDNLATHAAPVMREIGAKAAELAALAGEKAGPVAQKAAEVTGKAGEKLAVKGRDLATELRRDAAAAKPNAETAGDIAESTSAESTTSDDRTTTGVA